MSEMDTREAEMDRLLRRSMAAPVPRLSPDFQQRLSSELVRRSQSPSQFGQVLVVGYLVVSAVVSTVVMRDQGLGWGVIASMTIGPLAMVEAARRLRRSFRKSSAM